MASDTDELEMLYRQERRRLERLAVRRVGLSGSADVVQDVFVSLWARSLWARARETVTLTPAYLSRATQFMAISHFRAERRRVRFFDAVAEEQYSAPVILPDQIVAAREELQRFQDTIAALPERTRNVFLLNRLHHCTYDEIAVALDISYSTVEREIARAVLACKSIR